MSESDFKAVKKQKSVMNELHVLFGNMSKIPKMSRDLFGCLSSRRNVHSIWGMCVWGSILLKFLSVKDSAVLDILQE